MLFDTEVVAQKDCNAYVGLGGKEKGGEERAYCCFLVDVAACGSLSDGAGR